MKMQQFILTLLFFSCSSADKENDLNKTKPLDSASLLINHTNEKIYFQKLRKLFTYGDFDGDGIRDTIYQHNFSRLNKSEIDSSADPYQNEWDTVVKWFSNQQSDVYLTFNKSNKDTLHLGTGQGLYCLLNIGDINKDGKDEIAFVLDVLDFSNLNSCDIYSICKGKWTLLKYFEINESSFYFTGDTIPIFNNIEGYLEKQHNKWFYKHKDQEDIEKMIPLEIKKCI